MDEGYNNFLGSSVANLAFGALLAFIIWLKRRIKISRCKTNCHWFECESQLAELEHVKREVNTQRGMLQDVLNCLDAMSPEEIILKTPSKRIRAISV